MSDIPEDVMKRAREAVHAYLRCERTEDNATMCWTEVLQGFVARALMEERAAERERCAKKCEGDFDSEMRSYGDWFAREIRGQP